ncbi:HMG-box [Basidiobolus meristosporus CBS 931.73]|uniref:HMG-box n=1 Tax=Basidiobolus meristosporus CBS 931.73 TaxID=1314790 RepID=A0A1Y1Z484_9FUNG|nr:HMG-box [Basidiobolus meristosporus CBS 931.73]|eukprot:ORY05092.1 HMG-box [Basidiobolus meristosporus CBS 931.73]
MFRPTHAIRTTSMLFRPTAILQRGYTSRKKVTPPIDEKLTPPKRPISAYLRFHRDNLLNRPVSKNTVTDLSKRIGEKWNSLSDAEKKVYQDAEKEEYQEYLVKYKNFIDSLSPEDYLKLAQVRKAWKAQGKSFPKLKDPNAPRKPSTSYGIFLQEKYTKYKTDKSTETFRRIAQEWRQISDADRKHYEDLAAADRARYDQEIREYKFN